jgi:hypothetical protein
MIAHQGDAMEACRILEERTTERIENHRPRSIWRLLAETGRV